MFRDKEAILLYGSSTEILLGVRRNWSNEIDPTPTGEEGGTAILMR